MNNVFINISNFLNIKGDQGSPLAFSTGVLGDVLKNELFAQVSTRLEKNMNQWNQWNSEKLMKLLFFSKRQWNMCVKFLNP